MENEQAVQATNMYAEGASFSDISRDLEVSKSQVGGLLRTGIDFIRNNKSATEAPPVRTTEEQQNLIEATEHQNPLLLPRRSEVYTIETEGIGKKIVLTPKALMIFDLWRTWGFAGDLSNFVEDAIDFMYRSRRPMERGINYR